MRSFFPTERGSVPRRAHADLDGLKEDELGRQGFSGRAAELYRRNDPTTYRATGGLRLRNHHVDKLAPTDATDDRGGPLWLFENDDCRLSLSKRSAPMPFFARNVRADEVVFVHRGTGRFETEFGPIDYRPGDWVVIPKATTYRVVPTSEPDPAEAGQALLIVESFDEVRVPDYGPLGRTAPFDPAVLTIPSPEPSTLAPRRFEGGEVDEWEVRLTHGHEHSSIYYPHDPLDVVGWRGDLFPTRLNIADWLPVLSDRTHLPPPVHAFLESSGLMLGAFLPRPAEGEVGVERVPWYHRNADYDEVALFHGGDFLGFPLDAGLLTLSPQGLHHGAPEIARTMARDTHDDVSRVGWEIVFVDTRQPLRPNPEVFD